MSSPRAHRIRLFVLTLLSLAASAALGAAPDWPIKVGPTSRYLVDQSGRPVLLHADAAWSLIAGLTKEDAEIYLEDRRVKGFNTVIVNLIEHYFIDDPPRNAYGVAPFTTAGDFATPNETYFAHADWVIDRAAEKGIIVLLFPCYLGYAGTQEGWYDESIANGDAKNADFGRYVGARYRDRPNVIWAMSGDRDPEAARTMVEAMVVGIKEQDPNHIFTAHCERGHSGRSQYPTSPWLDFDTAYSDPTDGVFRDCLDAYAEVPAKPVFFVEGFYENTRNMTAADLRHQSYEALLSGACGEAFGNRPIWPFERGWQDNLNSAGSQSMVHVRALFESRRWYELVPDSGHQVVTSATGSGFSYISCARASDGSTAIVYLHDEAPTITVNLARISGASAKAWWFNPRDGTATSPEMYATTGARTFSRPDNNDWVLVLDDASQNLAAPGTAPTEPKPPQLTAHPAAQTVNAGDNATFSVAVTSEQTPAYQWQRAPAGTATWSNLAESSSYAGVTTASLAINATTLAMSGDQFRCVISNASGSATSNAATLTVVPTAPPSIVLPPASINVSAGSAASLTVIATGTAPLHYQWFHHGAPLAAGDTATLMIAATTPDDAGAYSVAVSNALGRVVSAIAFVSVEAPSAAPFILSQPQPLSVRLGARAQFRVTASGAAPLAYQWFHGDTPLPGATGPTLLIAAATADESGSYHVTITNILGTATSHDAALTVAGPNHAGEYTGVLADNRGGFALHVRDDQTGVFFAYDRSGPRIYECRTFTIADDGSAAFAAAVFPGGVATEPFTLTIASDGTVDGAATGVGVQFAGSRSADAGSVAAIAGLYTAGSALSDAHALADVGADGSTRLVMIDGDYVDAATGTTTGSGSFSAATERGGIATAAFDAGTSMLVLDLARAGVATRSFAGARMDYRDETEQLVNLSTRGPTSSGSGTMIAGLIIRGVAPKLVLLRGIGPSLAGFEVSGALAAVRLQLYRGNTLVAEANDWGAAGNVDDIEAAAARVRAFALPRGSRDSAMLTTLTPGAYTLFVLGQDSATGVALVEAYDATTGPIDPAERVVNLSTRGYVGGGDDVQIAGFVVRGVVPRRMLIRGVGPGLAPFVDATTVPTLLADPRLDLYDVGGVLRATNDDWSNAANQSAIATAAVTAGAFALSDGSKDAALLLHLEPGTYTAHLRGADGSTGVGLVEFYELP